MGFAHEYCLEGSDQNRSAFSRSSTYYYRGRVALYAALKALGVGRGDLVALQAFTCVAVPEAIIATGARPIYLDVKPGTFSLDPNCWLSEINHNFKAIVVQHTFGLPAKIEQILAISNAKGVPVIEDCCHTHDSLVSGKRVGEFGQAAFYSYEWGKPIAAGVGGELRVNDAQLEEAVQANYSNFCKPSIQKELKLELQYQAFKYLYRPKWYWAVRGCYRTLAKLGAVEGNYDVLNGGDFGLKISSGVLRRIEQTRNLSAIKDEHVSRLVSLYREINWDDSIIHPSWESFDSPRMSRYPLLVSSRDLVVNKARERGLEIAEWYCSPVHPLMGRNLEQVGYKVGSCPNSEKLAASTISLPLHLGVEIAYAERYLRMFN